MLKITGFSCDLCSCLTWFKLHVWHAGFLISLPLQETAEAMDVFFFLCGVYTWLGIHWFFHSSSSSGWVWLQSFWIFKIKWFMFIWGCWLILMTLFLVFNLAS